jgi:hypothetical protein
MASSIPPILIQLQADISGLKKGLADAQSAIKGVDSSVKTASTGINNFTSTIKKFGVIAASTFGASQIVSFLKSAANASAQAEAAQSRLATLLRNTNGATEAQIVALGDQAKALEKVGVVSADNITVAQSQLATFDLTAASIATLTPAILNYVTAEKGAAASADEFKQMTNGLAQAMQGNFASLTKTGFVLDKATKAQIANGTEMERSKAIVEVLNSTYAGFNENLRNTSQGAMQVAINDFNNLKQKIGSELVPVITQFVGTLTSKVLPALEMLVNFLVKNKDTIVAVSKVLLLGVAAYMAYRTAMIVTAATTTAFRVIQTLMKGAQLASIASTNGLAASMLVLNAAMKANPIGVIITALTLLAAGFVIAWKNSDTFRKVVISVAKAALTAIGFMIRYWGVLAEAIVNIVTGPMKLFLKLLSFISPDAKKAYDGLSNMTKGVGDWFDKAATKVEGFKSSLDKLQDKKVTVESKVPGVVETEVRTGNETTVNEKAVKERAKLEKERLADITKAMKEAAKIQEDMNKVVAESEKKKAAELKQHTENIIKITQEFGKKETALTKQYNEEQAKIRADYADRALKLKLDATRKEQEIIQKSIDQLRNAFAAGTSFNLTDAFKTDKSTGGLIAQLKNRLTGAKELQKNAAALAGKGYSQTFIEEVVKNGPEVGNEMAATILAASDDSTKELQQLYKEVDSISISGLDTLAKTMNAGGTLATKALMDEFSAVGSELKVALAEVNVQLTSALTESTTQYTENLATLHAELADALLVEQKSYKDAIDKINDDTKEKLDELKSNLLDTMATLISLKATQAQLATAQAVPYVAPAQPLYKYNSPGGTITTPFDTGAGGPTTVTNINQNFTSTSVNAQAVTTATMSAVKYGAAVTVASSTATVKMPVTQQQAYRDYRAGER